MDFFRLTSAPDPFQVRPVSVLERAFALVKSRFESGERDYTYLCSQLKSIRQHLTVQHVESSLTIAVYEYHAKVALDMQDYGELQQSLTRLQHLYTVCDALDNRDEFLCYQLLFDLLPSKRTARSDLQRRLTHADRAMPLTSFALAVGRALGRRDYHAFFGLHARAPLLAPHLTSALGGGLRLHALHCLLLAYRPAFTLAHAASATCFVAPREEADGASRLSSLRACAEFLAGHGCVWAEGHAAAAGRLVARADTPDGPEAAAAAAGCVEVDARASLEGFTAWQRAHNDAVGGAEALSAGAGTLKRRPEPSPAPAAKRARTGDSDSARSRSSRSSSSSSSSSSKGGKKDKKEKKEKKEGRASRGKGR
jgi:hypothetical protein